MDLGMDGAVPSTTAKKMVLQEAGGDVARAQQAWTDAGLPVSGPVGVDSLSRPAPPPGQQPDSPTESRMPRSYQAI